MLRGSICLLKDLIYNINNFKLLLLYLILYENRQMIWNIVKNYLKILKIIEKS